MDASDQFLLLCIFSFLHINSITHYFLTASGSSYYTSDRGDFFFQVHVQRTPATFATYACVPHVYTAQ